MIAAGHPEVSVERRCHLSGLLRASYYRGPAKGLRSGDLGLMCRMDELYLEHPWMGSRSLADHLTTPEAPVGRDRVSRLMLIMGIESLSPKPGTSKRQPKHPVYPYLLRGLTIDRPNQVWATDITYIPIQPVLIPQYLQAQGVADLHTPILVPPVVKSLISYPVLSANLRRLRS